MSCSRNRPPKNSETNKRNMNNYKVLQYIQVTTHSSQFKKVYLFSSCFFFLCIFLSFLVAFSLNLTLPWDLVFSSPWVCRGPDAIQGKNIVLSCGIVSQPRCFLFTLYPALLWVQPSAETKRSSTGAGVHPSPRTNRN